MKSCTIVSLKLFSLFVAVLFTFSLLSPTAVHAGQGDSMSGYAWSSNTGWIKTNSCDDIKNPATCATPTYGVTMPTTGTTRNITGLAWSSNLGWISFDKSASNTDTVLQKCPTKTTKGDCQAYADYTNPASVSVYGWARVCSVFITGCSGRLNADSMLGGWDGFISLSGASYGVKIDGNTGKMSGMAWGGEVIGWIDFSRVSITTPTVPTCSDGVKNQNETSVDKGGVCGAGPGTCTDGIQNQDETGIDVGGVCGAGISTCTDGIQNQDETSVDKGGVCGGGSGTCSDGIQNQDETSIDKGGVCGYGTDSCTDGIQNQDETGIDVGGVCTGLIPPSGNSSACSNIPGIGSPVAPPYKKLGNGSCVCVQPGYVLNAKTKACVKPVYIER